MSFVQIGDYLLFSDQEAERFHGPEDLRRWLRSQLGDDLTGIENKIRELGSGGVVAVRTSFSRKTKSTPIQDRSVPLRDVIIPLRERSSTPVQTAEAVETPWMDLTLVTDDGVPLADVALRITNEWGFDTVVTTDSEGHVRLSTELEAPHDIVVEKLPLVLPEVPTEPKEPKGFSLSRTVPTPLSLGANKPHTLVVKRPRATIVPVDGWWENQKVMVFQSARETDWGPVTIRGVFRQILSTHRGGEIHVVGHADSKGAAADNADLALIRAESVYLYLSGEREKWAAHAFLHADVATLQAALFWVAVHSVVECDPGPVDGIWGPVTSFGLMMLRLEAGIPPNNPLGEEDWCAIYDQFEKGLMTILATDASGLRHLRSRLQLQNPISKGEQHPSQVAEEICHGSRRVDIVFCAAESIPENECVEIYDGTFIVDHLKVSPECKVQIFTTDRQLKPMPFANVLVGIGNIGQRWMKSNIGGIVEITALREDCIVILRARDTGGTGKMINTGFQEAVLMAQEAAGKLEDL